MAQVTQLRRTLESEGYVEVTPRNEVVSYDFLMYVNNAEAGDKNLTINTAMTGAFGRDPNTTGYNESVSVTNGKTIIGHMSSGDESDAPSISDELTLQRVIRVEYLDADHEFPNTDPQFFYKDGYWVQGSRTSYKTIMKRNGFDGKLNIRVHYPRIISGCRLCVNTTSTINTSDVGGNTVVNKESTQTFDLDSNNLLGGYIDVQVSLFDDMDDAKFKVIDKKSNWHGSYLTNVINSDLQFFLLNNDGTVQGESLNSSCKIFLQEPLIFQSVSTAFLEKLEVTQMNGEVSVKFVDGAAHAQFRALASGFKGSNRYHELEDVGVSKGKRYVELTMESLDPNAYIGIVRPEINGGGSGYTYKKVIAVSPGKLWVNDEVVAEDPSILLNSSNTYSFAIDMETGYAQVSLNGKGWSGFDFSRNSIQDALSLNTNLLWVPERMSFIPVTYCFSIGDYSEDIVDGEVYMKARRSADEFVYYPPTGYTSF